MVYIRILSLNKLIFKTTKYFRSEAEELKPTCLHRPYSGNALS